MNTPFNFKHFGPSSNFGSEQPAIFLFHGLGSNEDDLLQLVENFKGQCHIFSIRGPIQHSPGFAFYTFEEEGKPTQEIFDKVVVFAKDFIQQAIEEYQLHTNKIYLLGFNQGAAITQTLTLILGEKVRGAVALSGFIPDFVISHYQKASVEQTKIFISHGEYDYVYPIQWAEQSRDFFIEQGAQVTYKTYPDGHGVTPENLKDLTLFIAEDLSEDVH